MSLYFSVAVWLSVGLVHVRVQRRPGDPRWMRGPGLLGKSRHHGVA